ncbi:hypothetical protein TIFTF001_010991, partial [Ficus carica]
LVDFNNHKGGASPKAKLSDRDESLARLDSRTSLNQHIGQRIT